VSGLAQVFTIGIVDDDEEVRESTAALLRSEGIRVQTFPDAESLLGSPLVDSIECLVTDLHMPGLDGFGLRRELMNQGKLFPVVMMTAFASPEVHEMALSLGISEFLEKPADPRQLLKVISSLLAS
jgi:FixJ family two-component response regulator